MNVNTNRRIHRGVVALAACCAMISALAGDLYVIANNGTSITGADVRDIFLGEKQLAGSVKLVPTDNGAAQEAFLAKVIKLDLNKYNTIWTKKSFREGLSAPPVRAVDAEVIEFVKKTPGAVGYVTSSPSGVTIVQKY